MLGYLICQQLDLNGIFFKHVMVLYSTGLNFLTLKVAKYSKLRNIQNNKMCEICSKLRATATFASNISIFIVNFNFEEVFFLGSGNNNSTLLLYRPIISPCFQWNWKL